MKVIRPTLITDATLISSDQPETDYPAWASGTVYALGAHVVRGHSTYESLQASNTGHDPALSASASWWVVMGPTNRWAMFDESGGTLTTGTGSINVTIKPGAVDSLAVLDTTAETVRVVMTDSGTVVYDETQSTNVGGAAITDWFLYFFEPIGRRSKLTFLDLPIFPNATIAVTLTGANPAAAVSVGTLAVGRKFLIGLTLLGGSLGLTDFSVKDTSAFGRVTITRRGYSNLMTLPVTLDREQTDAVIGILSDLRATACVWIGEEDYLDSVILYGWYTSLSLDLTFTEIHYCSLTINSLSQS